MSNNHKHAIIGGMFGLPKPLVRIPPSSVAEDFIFQRTSNLFLANARSGIFILVDLIKPSSVWMPSFLCPTMVDAIDQTKTNLEFYEVDCRLKVSSFKWIQKIQANDMVFLIDYFGFPLPANLAEMIKSQGGYVVEDACQALFSDHVGKCSDFVLFSPGKFLGIPDGGILASRCHLSLEAVTLKPIVQTSWWLKMLEASIARREFDRFGGERVWYQLFQQANACTPCGYYAMSDLSKELLLSCFDFTSIIKRRIENYRHLLSALSHIALFDSLPKGTVPLGFPIKAKQRDDIRANLFKTNIYPPLHWEIEGTVPHRFAESHLLASHILTLLCDQRYSINELDKITSMVKDIPNAE